MNNIQILGVFPKESLQSTFSVFEAGSIYSGDYSIVILACLVLQGKLNNAIFIGETNKKIHHKDYNCLVFLNSNSLVYFPKTDSVSYAIHLQRIV